MPLTDKEKQEIREGFNLRFVMTYAPDTGEEDEFAAEPKEVFDYFLSIIEEQRIKVLEEVEKEINELEEEYYPEHGVNGITKEEILSIITKAKGE